MRSDLSTQLLKGEKLLESGRIQEGIDHFNNLTQSFPTDLNALIGLVKALCMSGLQPSFELAISSVDRFMQSVPQAKMSPELSFFIAFAQEQTGKWSDAIKNYEVCIYFNPSNFAALFNLGNIFLEIGKYPEALSRFELCSELKPMDPEIYNNCGIAFEKMGQIEQCIAMFDKAVEVDQHFVKARANKAWVLLGSGLADKALESFQSLIMVSDPLDLKANLYKGQGLAQVELNRMSDALASFSRATELEPLNPEHYANRGNVLRRLGEFDLSRDDFNHALKLKSDYALVYSNLGNLYRDINDTAQALANFSRAIEIEPSLAQAHLNKALLLLGRAQFDIGFLEYEWRFATPEYSKHVLRTMLPLWDMVDFVSAMNKPDTRATNKKLLIWNEQGVGDDIYFVRFVQDIKALGIDVAVRVDPRLCSIFSRSWPGLRFIPEGQPIDMNSFDAHVPLGSTAKYARQFFEIKRSLSSGPKDSLDLFRPYLALDNESNLLNPHHKDEFVVGLSWLSTHPVSGAQRSVPLKELIKAFTLSNTDEVGANDSLFASIKSSVGANSIRFVSLQYSDVGSEINNVLMDCNVVVEQVTGLDPQQDLESLASLIGSCDLVISIDNTTAHLSAAIGAPTWVLLPLACDWRWQDKVVDNPIYGYQSAKTYQQIELGQWDAVLDLVRKDFNNFINLKSVN